MDEKYCQPSFFFLGESWCVTYAHLRQLAEWLGWRHAEKHIVHRKKRRETIRGDLMGKELPVEPVRLLLDRSGRRRHVHAVASLESILPSIETLDLKNVISSRRIRREVITLSWLVPRRADDVCSMVRPATERDSVNVQPPDHKIDSARMLQCRKPT